MDTTESVTVSSLEASVNLAGHSEFLAALLTREDLDLARRAPWTARLEEIRMRSRDPNLYLAVVGEFSSGKSTLANALIREALLPADVLPATTAVPVLVCSGPRCRLKVEYLDGHTGEITDGEVIRRQLAHLITSEEIACTVSRISIDHPAAVLREGFVVVDLPGSNVENVRHVEVARRTTRDLCDAALVAIPANIPVSETMAEFLRLNLEEVLHRCIFVVTKIDSLLPRDRARVLDTVHRRLVAKLGIASPLVLGASASAALGEPLPDVTDANISGDAYRELQAQFQETERQVIRFFQERRKLILLERIAALLAVLFDGVQEDLRAALDRCREEREVLEANLPRPLGPFLSDCRVHHGQALDIRLQTRADELLKSFATFRQQTLQDLWGRLVAAQNPSQVVYAATYRADDLMIRTRVSLKEEVMKALAQIGPEIREEMATFEANFRERYGTVDAAESSFANSDLPQAVSDDWAEWTRPKLVQAAREEGRRKAVMAIGAVLGIFVGFLLFFMLGVNGIFHEGNTCGLAFVALVFSPFFCAFLSSHLFIPVHSLRKAYWSDLEIALETFFSQIDSAILKLFEEAQDAAKKEMDLFFDRYLTRYGALVQDSVAKGESHIAEIGQVERRISGDLADFERRKLDLQQARNGLKQIQKL